MWLWLFLFSTQADVARPAGPRQRLSGSTNVYEFEPLRKVGRTDLDLETTITFFMVCAIYTQITHTAQKKHAYFMQLLQEEYAKVYDLTLRQSSRFSMVMCY